MVTGASFFTGPLLLGMFLRPNGGGWAADLVTLSFDAPPSRAMPKTGAFGFAFDGCGGGFARPGAAPAPEPVVTAMPARQICASHEPRVQKWQGLSPVWCIDLEKLTAHRLEVHGCL